MYGSEVIQEELFCMQRQFEWMTRIHRDMRRQFEKEGGSGNFQKTRLQMVQTELFFSNPEHSGFSVAVGSYGMETHTSATFFFFRLPPLLLSSSSFCFLFFCSSFFFLYFSSNSEMRSGQSRFSRGSHVFSVL